MPRTTLEVLIGTGTLYVAPTATAFPADPSVAVSTIPAWVDVGYSNEGWQFKADTKTADIEVAEEIDPIDVMATARECHMIGAAAQASLLNLQIALSGGTITNVVGPPAYTKFESPDTGDLVRYSVLFRGKAPTVAGVAKTRQVEMPWVVSVAAVDMAHKKAPDKTLIAMDFRLIKVTGTKLYTFKDLV